MPQHPMSAPDPAQDAPPQKVPPQPVHSTTVPVRAHLDDASFETDFADLAARFAAKSGGGLSPELCTDLALEIVLNEIVEQACLATGATGAAIVLPRDGEMVCRATSGSTAPELGSRLDTSSGLSGECVRTLRTQRCDDVLTDPRVDIDASIRLRVRSVMVMPLTRGSELLGVFELFSSKPNAFGERDEGTLEVLAGRTMSNLEHAARQVKAQNAESKNQALPAADRVSDIPFEDTLPVPADESPRPKFDYVTIGLAAAVLVCTLLLGVLVGRRLSIRRVAARTHSAATVSSESKNMAAETPVPPSATAESPVAEQSKDDGVGAKTSPQESQPRRSAVSKSAPGGLQIYENGKEIFRVPPAQNQPASDTGQESEVQRASSVEPDDVVKLSPQIAEGGLLHRVEPEYPEEAREQRIQGPVVLEVHIGADGAVQDVQVLSGQPLLAKASTAAVQQWRFKPRMRNGRPAEMQTKVTLNFRLPQP
jgi:TonB family protein